jgi:hypothetical protein
MSVLPPRNPPHFRMTTSMTSIFWAFWTLVTFHCLPFCLYSYHILLGIQYHLQMSGNDDLPELPPAPPSQVVGQGYSAHHKIPTVQGYKQDKARQDEEAKSYAAMIEKRQREAEERLEKIAAEQNAKESVAPQSGDGELEGDKQETNVLKNRKGKKDEQASGGATDEKSRMMEQMNANKGESRGIL